MFETCLAKEQKLKELFATCTTSEAKYDAIIDLGKSLSPLPEHYKTVENLVNGCQSQTYLHSFWKGDKICFNVCSDALISAGLAALLVIVYDEELPEVIFKHQPTYLEDLGISASLSPNRANGLYSIHLRMQQDVIKLLTEKK